MKQLKQRSKNHLLLKAFRQKVFKIRLANAHYFYAINLARWGNANGISASIGKLPELMQNLDLVNKLDETVEDFGA